MNRPLGIALLVLFLLLNIPNMWPGPYHWSQPLLFGFFPPQLFFWIGINLVAVIVLGWLMARGSVVTPWLKDDE